MCAMEVRECCQEDCPYCYWSMSVMGKRRTFCGMNKPFLTIACPRDDVRGPDLRFHKYTDF